MKSFSWNENGVQLLKKKWKVHFGWQRGVLAIMFTTEHPSPPPLILVNSTTIHQVAQLSLKIWVHSLIFSFHYTPYPNDHQVPQLWHISWNLNLLSICTIKSTIQVAISAHLDYFRCLLLLVSSIACIANRMIFSKNKWDYIILLPKALQELPIAI